MEIFDDVDGLFDVFDASVNDIYEDVDAGLGGLFSSGVNLINGAVNTANQITQGVQSVKNAFDSSTPTEATGSKLATAISTAVKSNPIVKWGLIAGGVLLSVFLVKKLVK